MQVEPKDLAGEDFINLAVKSSTLKRLIAHSQLHLDEIQCSNQHSKNTVLDMLKQVLLQH